MVNRSEDWRPIPSGPAEAPRDFAHSVPGTSMHQPRATGDHPALAPSLHTERDLGSVEKGQAAGSPWTSHQRKLE